MGLLRLASQLSEALGEKVHHDPDSWCMPQTLVSQQPKAALIAGLGGQAHNEIGIEIGNQAGQDSKTDA